MRWRNPCRTRPTAEPGAGYNRNRFHARGDRLGVTISDVARLAGVGRATVSRVLNERPNVDPRTRARVLEAIAALDFVPNPTARRLSLRRTQTIAVILPFLTRPSAVERLRGVEAALVRGGYDMIVFNVETVERREAVFRDLPRRERVDGLIIVSLSPHESELERIDRIDAPGRAHRRPPPLVATGRGRRRAGRTAGEQAPPGARSSPDRFHRRHPAHPAGVHLESAAADRRPAGDHGRRPHPPRVTRRHRRPFTKRSRRSSRRGC